MQQSGMQQAGTRSNQNRLSETNLPTRNAAFDYRFR